MKNMESIERLRFDVAFFGVVADKHDAPRSEHLCNRFHFIVGAW